MKKIKILAFASLPLVLATLAGCDHEHEFSEEWEYDEETHWRECVCGEMTDVGEHIDSNKDQKCDVCGHGMYTPTPTPHEHKFSSAWSYDFLQHWHACEVEGCDEKQGVAGHTFVDGKCECGLEEANIGYSFELNGVSKNLTVDPNDPEHYLTGEVELKAGDQMSFFMVGGTTKQALKDLKAAKSDYGFVVNNGVLSTVISGKFELRLNLHGGFNVLEALKGTVERPYKGFVYANGTSLFPTGAPFSFVNVDRETGTIDYVVGPQGISSETTVTLEIKKDNEVLAITSLGGDAAEDFKLSDDKKVVTYVAEGNHEYNFFVKESIVDSSISVAIENASSPTPTLDVRLMGFEGDWEGGRIMNEEKKGVYVANSIDVKPGDAFKVKCEENWIDNYVKTGGNFNAFAEHLCEVDEEGNVKFNFSGVFTIFYNSDQSSSEYGVFVRRDSVTSKYFAQASLTTEFIRDREEQRLMFNKVDLENNFIEFSYTSWPTVKGMNYVIVADEVNLDFTFEDGGERANFEKNDKVITYQGDAGLLDFYLKEDLASHELTLYVEEHLEMTYSLTINCESDQSKWAFSEEVDLFVGAINGEGKTTWIKVSAKENVVNTDVPQDTVKFLMVRCVKGTETPNWEIKEGDEVGRIYNQTTPDTVLVKGPGVYTVHFVDYPMPA